MEKLGFEIRASTYDLPGTPSGCAVGGRGYLRYHYPVVNRADSSQADLSSKMANRSFSSGDLKRFLAMGNVPVDDPGLQSKVTGLAAHFGPLSDKWDQRGEEHFVCWWLIAHLANALIRVSHALTANLRPAGADLKLVSSFVYRGFSEIAESVSMAALGERMSRRKLVSAAISRIVEIDGCYVGIEWQDGAYRVAVVPRSLLAAIGLQLMEVVSDRPVLQIFCDECGKKYDPPGKKPRNDRGQFCPECQRRGVPARRADQRYRDGLRDRRRASE